MIKRRFALPLAIVATAFAGAASAQTQLPSGTAIDPTYIAQFSTCDATDVFAGVPVAIIAPNGQKLGHGCKTDPSKLHRLDRVAASGSKPETIIFTSKLAWDADGSEAACHHAGGPTDQCATSLKLLATKHHPCLISKVGKFCVPVNPDEIPYVVIPTSVPAMKWAKPTPKIDAGAFRRLTGVNFGDYGVVILADTVVPVIVADGGPAYKAGEGSTALLKALSADGKPRAISSGVTFVLFPRTRIDPAKLNADHLAASVAEAGQACFSALTGGQSAQSLSCAQKPASH